MWPPLALFVGLKAQEYYCYKYFINRRIQPLRCQLTYRSGAHIVGIVEVIMATTNYSTDLFIKGTVLRETYIFYTRKHIFPETSSGNKRTVMITTSRKATYLHQNLCNLYQSGDTVWVFDQQNGNFCAANFRKSS